MEKLAWVEVLDRHGDVSVRHPVFAWPLKVGRAYTSDIVLDDPYVAADHLEITHGDDGLYQIKVVNSFNAMTLDNVRGKRTEAAIPANRIVRIGQTQLRIRPLDYAVSAEQPLPGNAWSRSWPAFFIGVAVLELTHLLTLWLNYDRAEGYNILLSPVIGAVAMLMLWAGFWALIGRVLSGRANFIAHAVNASLGIALFIFLDSILFDYGDFALDTNIMSTVFSGITGMLIVGALLYRHICLVSRIGRRKLVIILAGLMVGLAGFGYISEEWTADEHLTDMSFSGTIGPPFLSLTHEKPAEAFIAEAEKLKSKADNP